METRAGEGQRYLLGVWIAISVLTPLFGLLGARGFAAGLALMGIFTLPLARPKKPDWIGLGLLAALLAWASVSVIWTPAPNLVVHSFKDFTRTTPVHLAYQLVLSGAFVVVAGTLRERTAMRALDWLGYGLIALALILVEEGVTQAALYQHLQGVLTPKVRPDLAVRNVALGGYVIVALVWPAGVALYRRRGLWPVLALMATVIFSTFVLRGDSPSVALVLSALVFAAVYRFGRPAIMTLAGLTAFYWISAPAVVLALQKSGLWDRVNGHLPPSWNARLNIWSFADQRILEHPLGGWGLDASRAFHDQVPLHPHDGGLQVWFELGLPGVALITTFWLFLFWRIARTADERLFAGTACAAATVYLVIGGISFGLWQEWWICLGALSLAACIALRRGLKATPA